MKHVLQRSSRLLLSRTTVGLCLLALFILLRIWDPLPIQELRLKSYDFYQILKPLRPIVHPVVIVDIDEASLDAYGQWPWPRTRLADLVTRLENMGAVAMAFDIVFPEPDRLSPNEVAKSFTNLDEATRERLLGLPTNDAVFAEAIRRGKVVLGQSGTLSEKKKVVGKLPQTSIAIVGPDPTRNLIAFPHLLRNVPDLERAAAGRGLFSIGVEQDGIVRRVPIVMTADGKIVPGLVVDLLRVVSGSDAILIRTDSSGVRSVAVPGLELPTDQNGRIWVHFSPHDLARYVSAKDVLDGKVDPKRFAGKLVLLGTSAIGLLDIKTTPIDPVIPGVEVQAQLLEAALTNSLLAAPSYGIGAELLATLFAGVLLSLIAPFASAATLLAGALVLVGAFAGTSWIAYSRYDLLFDATFPVSATSAVYTSLILIGYFREQVDRRRIRSAFAQYLSPTLVARLAESPKSLVLGGEDRNLTILFSDVRGFTTISESYKHDPQGLTVLMNRLLTPLTDAIIARNGTIDKYIGDAVMAFWNAPLDDSEHETRACHAALDMLACVDALNEERQREASAADEVYLPIRIGIGINTGHCTVGNMGSNLRFQYTAMGDSVNLASRLEGQTKFYDVPIIIGPRTASAVSGQFAVLEIEWLRVKGKTEPELVYALLGRADVAQTSEFTSLRERWAQLLVCYRKQDWAGALATIDQCRGLCSKFALDQLLEIYGERIRELQQKPPGVEWDGVFTAGTK